MRLQLRHGHARFGHHVGHQLQALGIAFQRQCQDHGVADIGQPGEHATDFTRFDAIATDFHLVIGTPDKFHQAFSAQPRPVAGAVQAGAIGRRHEAFGRQRGLAQVTLGNALATQVELADHLRRQRVEVAIEHFGAGIAQRAPDRHRAAVGQALVRFEGEHADRGLGRAVVVDDAAFGAQCADFFQQAPRARFTAQNQCFSRQHIGGAGSLQQALQVAWHQLHHAHLMLRHVAGETIRVEGQLLR
ncbi:hypothetical protein D3C80_1401060 [compost metagenome]